MKPMLNELEAEMMAPRLVKAWKRYVDMFGKPPDGSYDQLLTLAYLMDKEKPLG